MQLELKEFLSTLPPYAFGGAAKKVFERNKKPAIWYRFQQVGAVVEGLIAPKRKRNYLVVDGAKVRTREGQIWIFAAIDPENREIVGMHVSKYRESIDVLQFLKRCLVNCEGRPILISDGGP